ncbi:hypothetical protein JHK86_015329 [Glycine max]|nr:hypothetical protein JHK86_015329 [Glycine max]
MASPSSEFMLSDYLVLEDALVVDHHQESWSQSTETESSEKATSSDASHGFGDATSNTNMHMQSKLWIPLTESAKIVGLRERMQKNYYKCSGEGCDVKKRVERDRDDSNYVLTTYDGVHNHQTPSTAYYSQMPLLHSNHDWALHPSANS